MGVYSVKKMSIIDDDINGQDDDIIDEILYSTNSPSSQSCCTCLHIFPGRDQYSALSTSIGQTERSNRRRWLSTISVVDVKATLTRMAPFLLVITCMLAIWLTSSSRVSTLVSNSTDALKNGTHLDDDDLFGWRQRLPQALIIGAKKCGTGALRDFIKTNAYIRAAPREVHFFDEGDNYAKGLPWYRKQMPGSRFDDITLEKSPRYFVSLAAPERVRNMSSDTLLILIVRDPISRLISDYVHIKDTHTSLERSHSLEELVLDKTTGQINASYPPVQVGLYHIHFRRWLEQFPRKQIHVVDGERFIRDPYPVLYELETFLGIQHLVREALFRLDESKGFFCRLTPDLKPRCLGSAKGRAHPKLPAELAEKLENFYQPHTRLFFDMIGETFTWK